MHEMSLCEGVLDVIVTQSKEQGFNKVLRVFLEIGDLAGVEIASLKFCFDVVMRGSIAKDAELVIIKKQGVAWCFRCAKSIKVAKKFAKCPLCGSYQLQIQAGDEMRVKQLEVE
jgi:hydrogenase nickel incorporation protein HypA/HybF